MNDARKFLKHKVRDFKKKEVKSKKKIARLLEKLELPKFKPDRNLWFFKHGILVLKLEVLVLCREFRRKEQN